MSINPALPHSCYGMYFVAIGYDGLAYQIDAISSLGLSHWISKYEDEKYMDFKLFSKIVLPNKVKELITKANE